MLFFWQVGLVDTFTLLQFCINSGSQYGAVQRFYLNQLLGLEKMRKVRKSIFITFKEAENLKLIEPRFILVMKTNEREKVEKLTPEKQNQFSILKFHRGLNFYCSPGTALLTSFSGIPVAGLIGSFGARGFNRLGKYTLHMGNVTNGSVKK